MSAPNKQVPQRAPPKRPPPSRKPTMPTPTREPVFDDAYAEKIIKAFQGISNMIISPILVPQEEFLQLIEKYKHFSEPEGLDRDGFFWVMKGRIPKECAEMIYDSFDTDHNGTLDIFEFSKMIGILYGGSFELKMKAASDIFKMSGSKKLNKNELCNSLRLVFYNLAASEIENITNEIYTESKQSTEGVVNILDVLKFFENHPEITNEKKPEFTRSSSASLPQCSLLRDTRQPMSDGCISLTHNNTTGTPHQSQLFEQSSLASEMTPFSQEATEPLQQHPVIVVNYYIQERLNKNKDEDIGAFGVASRDILVDNPKLETALLKFLANKEVSSKELFYKKIGGINYCTTIAATCEQVPSLICTLFEKFAEVKNEYIEIEDILLDKRIKGKGRYADSIRHDQKAVEKAATMFHTSTDRIKKLFSLYLAHRILISEFLEKEKAYDEAKDNVVMNTVDDVTSNIPTDFAGLAAVGIKTIAAGVRYAYYKKMSEKNKELARHYIGNIFAIQRFLNVMGCIASLFDILSHKNSFDHAMESNVLVYHLDERRITDEKEQLEHYDHNHGCFCGFLDKGEANGETMQQWVSKNQPVWSKLNELFGSKEALKTDDGSYYYIDYDTLGERMKREKLFENGFKIAETFHYHPLLSPLLEVGLSIAQIDKFRKSFEEIKSANIIYDSEIDEKSAKTCHKKIDGKGPTITFAVKGDKMIGGITYQNWTAGDGKKFDEFIRDTFATVFCITQEMQVCPVKCYDRALYGDIGYGPIFGFFELTFYPEQMNIAINNRTDYNLPSFRESFYEPDETGTSKVDRIVVLSFEYDSEKLVQRMFGDKEKASNFIRKCGTAETAERTLRKTQSVKEAEELVSQCSTEKEINKKLDGIKMEKKEYREGMNECNFCWLFDGETLTIVGKGKMKDYKYEFPPWDTFKGKIKEVIVFEGITSIGEGTFEECSSLTIITIPNSVTTIGDYAFSECSSLTSVTIPNSVTTIGEWAFANCSSLTSITIPESVTSIGEYGFCGCSKLTSIHIPKNVKEIGQRAFGDCSNLSTITVDEMNEHFKSIDNVLFTKDGTKLIQYAQAKTETSYIIPDGVVVIDEAAFDRCSHLESITIPDSVTTIGEYAFSDCSSLTSITIPNSVTKIGRGAFGGCSSLITATIPKRFERRKGRIFYQSDKLTTINWTE